MTDHINNSPNPWKGVEPYSYQDSSIFSGRSRETDALVDTIVNNHFTIVYGPSGVGKSSLLNAGVRPKLSSEVYFVVYISMRQLDLKSANSISSQLLANIRECAQKEGIDITPLAKTSSQDSFEDSLWYFFHTNEFWSRKNELLVPLVFIDQFEDIFKDEVREQTPEYFFNCLGDLSNVVPPVSIREKIDGFDDFQYKQSADFRFVFSLREDYLPRLDDYVFSLDIPELRKSRFTISLMDESQAREVILKPAAGIVTERVADKIINILFQDSHNHNIRKSRSYRVAPFILSLYMYRVYEEMKKQCLAEISEDLINRIGVDVVNDFYVESMQKVGKRSMRYLEKVLLTSKGNRDSISYGKLDKGKVSEGDIEKLLKARILTRIPVNEIKEDDRIEFTHDILCKCAQKNKEERDNSVSRQRIGYLGIVLVLVLAGVVGLRMSPTITYISIPILIVSSIMFCYVILNVKSISKRNALSFLFVCGLLGVFIDFIQIVPTIGYVLFVLVCILSFFILKKFADKIFMNTSSMIAKYGSLSCVWMVTFLFVPILCFGYNIFDGMNYSRGSRISSGMFYVKNEHGQYGLRNRGTVLIKPAYDGVLIPVGTDYVCKSEGKFGLLDSNYQVVKPTVFDSFSISNDEAYFYMAGKEIADNGLVIDWNESVSDEQKEVLRRIISSMISVKGGEFAMGTDVGKVWNIISDFKPMNGEDIVHKVILSDYFLSKFEVTFEDWIPIMGYDPRKNAPLIKADSIDNLKIPVYKVSYENCVKFIEKISSLTGLAFSLPTEAQWEYAARGGIKHDDYIFSGSNSEFDVGWVAENSGGIPHAVGEKRGNGLRFVDMTGNVSEFCKDCMSEDFYRESEEMENPCCEVVNQGGKSKVVVVRGGSFETNSPNNIITRRMRGRANTEYSSYGFRLAINPPKK